MKKPLIGITTGLFTVETGVFAGMERVYLNRDYVDAVERKYYFFDKTLSLQKLCFLSAYDYIIKQKDNLYKLSI